MAVPGSHPVGARRLVTVLFADLVGFTTLSEHLDPEDVATIQQAYFERARAAVEDAGGTVEKFIGDAVVGTFGLPHAHGDDPGRGVAAGLAIIDEVAHLGAALGLDASTLRVRVGVNTGEVHATFDPDGAWQLTGNVVNVAARLQSASEPGHVLIGPATALAAEPAYTLRAVGPLDLKGKAEKVSAWQVVGARDIPSRAWAMRGLHAPTLGRDVELDRLVVSLTDRSVPGWLVNAPPGAGKTRLVDELEGRARRAGHPVWRAAVAEGGGSGYGAVAQLLRTALDIEPGADPAEVRAALTRRFGEEGWTDTRAAVAAEHVAAVTTGAPLEAEPAELHPSWIAALDAAAGLRGPNADTAPERVLWIVEDIHNASPDLLTFLRRAVSGSATPPAVVLTCRPGLLADAGPDPVPGLRLLHLPPLAPALVLALVDALVGPGVVPPAAAAGIASTAGGNPLFVEELLRTWVQAEVLGQEADGTWRFRGAGDDLALPTTVHAVYQSQLDDLGTGAREVATSGSVPGHSFPAGALPALGIDEPEDGLGELGALGLLTGPHDGFGAPDAYTYRHALLRDVAYATLSRRLRARLHLRFARWMGDVADPTMADELVGTHLAAAHASLPALAAADDEIRRDEIATEAGARLAAAAERHLAAQPQRAAELLAQALAVDTDAPDTVAAHRHLRRAEALRRSGRLEEAMATFTVAGDLVPTDRKGHDRTVTDQTVTDVAVSAALGYEDALFASRLPRDRWGPDGRRLLERALAGVADDATRALLLAAQGRALTYAGQPDQGTAVADRAVTLARDTGDDRALAHALLAARAGQTGPADLDTRRHGAAELVAAAERAGDREAAVEGLRLLYVDLLEAGHHDEAAEVRERAEAAIAELRRPLYLWYPAMWRAMEAVRTGAADAGDAVEAFRREGDRWQYRDVGLVHAAQALHLAVDRGSAAGDLGVIEPVLTATGATERFRPVLTWAHTAAGDHDGARRRLAEASADRFAGLPRDLSWLYCVALYAEAAAALGDTGSSRVLADLLAPWVGQGVVLGSGAVSLGAAAHYAGAALAGAGDPDGAVPLLSAAVVTNEAAGAAPAARRSRALLSAVEAGRPLSPPGVGVLP